MNFLEMLSLSDDGLMGVGARIFCLFDGEKVRSIVISISFTVLLSTGVADASANSQLSYVLGCNAGAESRFGATLRERFYGTSDQIGWATSRESGRGVHSAYELLAQMMRN